MSHQPAGGQQQKNSWIPNGNKVKWMEEWDEWMKILTKDGEKQNDGREVMYETRRGGVREARREE